MKLRPRKFEQRTLLRSLSDVFDEGAMTREPVGDCCDNHFEGEEDSEDEEFYRK